MPLSLKRGAIPSKLNKKLEEIDMQYIGLLVDGFEDRKIIKDKCVGWATYTGDKYPCPYVKTHSDNHNFWAIVNTHVGIQCVDDAMRSGYCYKHLVYNCFDCNSIKGRCPQCGVSWLYDCGCP